MKYLQKCVVKNVNDKLWSCWISHNILCQIDHAVSNRSRFRLCRHSGTEPLSCWQCAVSPVTTKLDHGGSLFLLNMCNFGVSIVSVDELAVLGFRTSADTVMLKVDRDFTHWGMVTHICVSEPGHHRSRSWFVTCSVCTAYCYYVSQLLTWY